MSFILKFFFVELFADRICSFFFFFWEIELQERTTIMILRVVAYHARRTKWKKSCGDRRFSGRRPFFGHQKKGYHNYKNTTINDSTPLYIVMGRKNGRSLNPADAHRKEMRKKELKKARLLQLKYQIFNF